MLPADHRQKCKQIHVPAIL